MRRISWLVLCFPIVCLFISHFDSISPCYMAHHDVHTYNFCLCSPAHTNALSIQLKAAQSIIMTSAWQLLLLLLLSYVQLGEACLQWCFLPTMRLNVTGQWSSAWWYSCQGGRTAIRHDSYALVHAAAKFPAKVVVWLCGCELQNNNLAIGSNKHSCEAGMDRVRLYNTSLTARLSLNFKMSKVSHTYVYTYISKDDIDCWLWSGDRNFVDFWISNIP